MVSVSPMLERSDAPSRRRLLVLSCMLGLAVLALLISWLIVPSVRARTPMTAAAPDAVNVITVPPPGLGTAPSPAVTPPESPVPVVEGWPPSVSGRVRDADGKPLAGASIVADGREVRADAEGAFTLGALPPTASVIVKLPGYAKATIAPTQAALDVKLKRHAVKGAYLTYYGFADRQIRGRVLDLVSRTDLNR